MLKITVPEVEEYDPAENCFVVYKSQELTLEHSLISVSKWESKWRKSFVNCQDFTDEELKDYVRCMTLTSNVDPNVYSRLTYTNYKEIMDYINDPMTATTFSDKQQKSFSKEVITSEIVYYWMVALNIPFECQKWHFNRLITLIRVISIKNAPSKKMSKRGIYSQNRSLNAARRRSMNTKG